MIIIIVTIAIIMALVIITIMALDITQIITMYADTIIEIGIMIRTPIPIIATDQCDIDTTGNTIK